MQQREVVAEADHFPLGGPLGAQRGRVEAEHVVQGRFGADGAHVRHALGRNRQALDLRGVVVDKQSSHDRTERFRVGGKAG
jgi:hypothetical protein